MKTNHTPGPWSAHNGSIFAGECTGVAWVGMESKEGNANARLIASAPDLLEIAMRALEYAPNEIEANKCRAAIAKALGK